MTPRPRLAIKVVVRMTHSSISIVLVIEPP
jgi:hypothetical protein